MDVRHPKPEEDILTVSIKSVHRKGADNNPKP